MTNFAFGAAERNRRFFDAPSHADVVIAQGGGGRNQRMAVHAGGDNPWPIRTVYGSPVWGVSAKRTVAPKLHHSRGFIAALQDIVLGEICFYGEEHGDARGAETTERNAADPCGR